MPVLLDKWAVIKDPYEAPEIPFRLSGVPTGHPRKPDGKRIKTSRVSKIIGREVTTESGTIYYLMEPSERYREWLTDNVPDWDPERPIKTSDNYDDATRQRN